ncbi:MAG: hypothetical protein N3B01_06740 [Verrucomicrobiae bacterium]|nr:hypothetical protein [Verrucomicrobiae bacterium]
MTQRPTSVTVFGVLNIVFGAWALLCTPFGLAMEPLMQADGNPVLRAMQDNEVYRLWTIGDSLLGMLAGAVMVAAGIGLLQLKPWARLTSIGLAIYSLIDCVLNIGMLVFVFMPLVEGVKMGGGREQAAALGALIGGIVGGSAGCCLDMIYSILLLGFMSRPNVKAAFQSQA